MAGFVEGVSRDQATLFPERLDELIKGDAPVRVVDAFVEFLWSEKGQRLFVENGFRSVEERLNASNPAFGKIADPFLIKDFGGWSKAKMYLS